MKTKYLSSSSYASIILIIINAILWPFLFKSITSISKSPINIDTITYPVLFFISIIFLISPVLSLILLKKFEEGKIRDGWGYVLLIVNVTVILVTLLILAVSIWVMTLLS